MTNRNRFALALTAAAFSIGLLSVPAAQAADDAMMGKAMHKHMKKHKGMMKKPDAMHKSDETPQ